MAEATRPVSRRTRRGVVAGAGVLLLGAALLGFGQLTRTAPAEPPLAAPVDPASGDVTAFPAPGTVTIVPGAQLSFRGADDLGDLSVVGADSGEHPGSVLTHPDGGGVSFVPDEPFDEGEEVTVSTGLAVRGTDGGTYTLRVAELGDRPRLEAPPVTRAVPDAGEEEVPLDLVHQLVSEPALEPPLVEVTGPEAGTTAPPSGDVDAAATDASPGLTAVGVKNGFGQKGPMLVDDAGEPVWFLPLTGVDARDVQVQTYRGEPVLTWWEGLQATGYGYGEAVVMDQTYTEIARFDMVGYDSDAHEVLLTEDGTALLMAYEPVRMDLSDIGGPAYGQVVDNIIQEVDVATGALLFEWHSVGQVGLAESYLEMEGGPYDYFHANSIDVDDDGDLLVSARHTCAAYSLDRETGSVEWRLGGRESDFAMGEGTTFLKQHDVRRVADGALTLLDNGGTCGGTTREVSRGIALELDTDAMTAELVREVIHPEELFAESQASYTELPGGNAQIGWGSLPRWTLFDADGDVLLDARIDDSLDITSYRAPRVQWVGRPTTDPAAVLAGDGASVHASWNGATEVAAWRVVDASGTEVAAAERAGFETEIAVPGGRADLRIEALDAAGEVLGTADVAAAG
ncbi:arylsulfotransferase family protein [Georgenia subflava]|uniref:ArsR family transcriptional regulator n=1 Tax=Georgenia subflava TaxID=1622177 RepID=A0A6N7EH22_9MICO|nr:arylsulfotransferase family protein [Georgenia subflava]MPV35446.1 hypothetical protein [Georgenia subflava]